MEHAALHTHDRGAVQTRLLLGVYSSRLKDNHVHTTPLKWQGYKYLPQNGSPLLGVGMFRVRRGVSGKRGRHCCAVTIRYVKVSSDILAGIVSLYACAAAGEPRLTPYVAGLLQSHQIRACTKTRQTLRFAPSMSMHQSKA